MYAIRSYYVRDNLGHHCVKKHEEKKPEREIALRDYSEDLVAGEYLTESTRDDPVILGATIVEKLKRSLSKACRTIAT